MLNAKKGGDCMQKIFDVAKFINNLGEDLITVFNRSSDLGIHPEEVGRAKEINIAKQLESILPHGVGVGRGYVFDSYGNISNQCDLVLYEKELIPIFVRDLNDDYSFFPCEGVIAVGEIKSTLNLKELNDVIEKLAKIKRLKRNYKDNHEFRHFLQTCTMYGADSELFDPANKSFDNIFTFIFCRDNVIDEDTLLSTLMSKYGASMEIGLDRIYSINKSVVSKAYISADSKTLFSEIKPNSYCTLKTDNRAFELLIDDLSLFVRYGRSQQFNMRNYYKTKDIYIDKYITHI